MAPVRAALGESAWAAAWAEGRALPLEDGITLALAPAGPPAAPVAKPRPASPLAAREEKVAALIAQGLSNRQIAERLVVAEGTVALHVHNILGKLGCASRTQVAAWAAARGLGAIPSG